MILRLAHDNDLNQILEIYGYYVDHSSFTFDYHLPSSADYLKKIKDSHSFIVAEESNTIYGFAYAGSHRAKPAYKWVCESTIYLLPDKTTQGMGKRLYSALIDLLFLQGYMSVLAGITRPNPVSVKFHESMGFIHAYSYENVGYKFNKWHSVDWYRLDLRSFSEEPPPIIKSVIDLGQEEMDQILRQYSN
ncbi:MAG: N-acetyltransferase [Flavobacteriales bacterium]|nr:N-acetyltransferase [Flavobacteriales bacterium]